jgi:hypothetical protein
MATGHDHWCGEVKQVAAQPTASIVLPLGDARHDPVSSLQGSFQNRLLTWLQEKKWLYPNLPTDKWKNDESSSSSAGDSECA